MLKKCLKYDLIAVAKIWWIAAATVLVLAVPVGFCMRDISIHARDYGYNTLSWFGVMFGYVGAVAFAIVTVILFNIRYYGNFFRDEGYLTFTLPVKRKTLFLSKVLNGMIWSFAGVVVIGIALCIVFGMSPDVYNDGKSILSVRIGQIGGMISDLYENAGGWTVVILLELAAMAVLALLAGVLSTYLCITVGAVLVRKHKLLASIGTLYGFHCVSTIAGYAGLIMGVLWLLSGEAAFPNAQLGNFDGILLFLLPVLILGVVDTLLAFISLGCLERKLNLS